MKESGLTCENWPETNFIIWKSFSELGDMTIQNTVTLDHYLEQQVDSLLIRNSPDTGLLQVLYLGKMVQMVF